jgi:hypothetical protein
MDGKVNLLIAVAMQEDLHPQLRERCKQLIDAMVNHPDNKALFEMDTAVHVDADPPTPPEDAGKFWQQARVRNEVIDQYLYGYHQYVLWVDADLVDYPADLPARLYEANPEGITAPLVLLEQAGVGKEYRPGKQFYDTLGFIENGRRVRHMPPYFDGDGELVELDSVGCIYLAPADLLRHASYESFPVDRELDHPTIWRTGHTDHWPIMVQAAMDDLPIVCLTTVTAVHAYLPKYGEGFH